MTKEVKYLIKKREIDSLIANNKGIGYTGQKLINQPDDLLKNKIIIGYSFKNLEFSSLCLNTDFIECQFVDLRYFVDHGDVTFYNCVFQNSNMGKKNFYYVNFYNCQ